MGLGSAVNNHLFRCFNWNGRLPNMTLEGNGMKMCYGRRTGYGGYGGWARGGRQIVLRENVSETPIETWIRLEDETAGARMTLNSTYGQDRYVQKRHAHESRGRKNSSSMRCLVYVYLFVYLLISLIQTWRVSLPMRGSRIYLQLKLS